MVTFTRNPYEFAGDSDINSAVVKVDLTYKNKAFPVSSRRRRRDVSSSSSAGKAGVGVTVPTNLTVNPHSFSNATLSNANKHMTTIRSQ